MSRLQQLIIQINMYNFWSPHFYLGCSMVPTPQNIWMQSFWYDFPIQNQEIPQNEMLLNRNSPQPQIIKMQVLQEQEPNLNFQYDIVKQQEARSISSSQIFKTQQEFLTKNDLIKLKGSYQKLKWSQQDDNLLIDLFQNQQAQVSEIVKNFQGASQKMCLTRYRRLKKTQFKYWTRQQDKTIKRMVNQLGQKWKQISKHVPNRSAKQIREHYINLLRPQIKKTPWTAEQDILLSQLVKQKGNQWRLFETFLTGRTQNHIKNRYYGRIKKIQEIKKYLKNSNDY